LKKHTSLRRIFSFPHLSLVVVLILSFLSILLISPTSIIAPIRWLLGIGFTLFLPGYVLIGVIFPSESDIDSYERVVYSIALSVVLVSVIGMILDKTPCGIDLAPIMATLTIFVVLSSIGMQLRRGEITWLKQHRKQEESQPNKEEKQTGDWDVKWKLVLPVLIGLLSVTVLLKMPLITLDAQEGKFGVDIAEYTYLTNVLLQIKHIPIWSSYMKYDLPARFAPGIPILFGSVSQVTGIEPIKLTMPYYVLTFMTLALSLYVMLVGYTNKKWLSLIGLFIWVFGANSYFGAAIVFQTPEAIWTKGMGPPNLVGWLFLSVFLLSVLKFKQKHDYRYVFIMFALMDGIMVFHQLTFMLVLLFFLFFLILNCSQISWKPFLLTILAGVMIVCLTLPDYILYASLENLRNPDPESILWLSRTSIDLLDMPGFLGYSASIFAIFGILNIERRTKNLARKGVISCIRTNAETVYFAVCLLSLMILMQHGPNALGINGRRFLYFTPFFLLPLMVKGIDGLSIFSEKCKMSLSVEWKKKALISAIVALMVVSLTTGVTETSRINTLSSRNIFGSLEKEAAIYLRDHATNDQIIVADLKEPKYTMWLLPFSMKYVFIRLTDYAIATATPPYDAPMKLLDQILRNPNASNVKRGYATYNFTFYYLSKPYNWREIAVFDSLPYFTRVFENLDAKIYRVDPSRFDEGIFMQAEDFATASEDISVVPFTDSIGPISDRTYILSYSDKRVDQGYAVYSLNISRTGTYTFMFRRYVFQPQEYVIVFMDGVPLGNVSFSRTGWQSANLTNIGISQGHHSLTLAFMNVKGMSDGLDYIVLNRNSDIVQPTETCHLNYAEDTAGILNTYKDKMTDSVEIIVDNSVYMQGKGSWKLTGTNIHKLVGAKFSLGHIWNFSNRKFIMMWVRMNEISNLQFVFNIYDTAGNSGTWKTTIQSANCWKLMILPIDQCSFKNTSQPVLSSIDKFSIQINNLGGQNRTITLWVDAVFVV